MQKEAHRLKTEPLFLSLIKNNETRTGARFRFVVMAISLDDTG
ncbi:hypothetical protein HMPREF0083_01949 [Aneurinibacillus aneurinilyticus ATCC 12856]|uniref:Uncharacterized protein n=2 Tax=Aneurinibacillus aneurinilyticus TaxID=1391 RepID=U1YGU0_ANEAE|nr:hypothetical protein HMPREF0083_01949 [Aneurinibacillus aneurinilyticus ATCC 12856]